jgi:hypothetical protein
MEHMTVSYCNLVQHSKPEGQRLFCTVKCPFYDTSEEIIFFLNKSFSQIPLKLQRRKDQKFNSKVTMEIFFHRW